MISKTERQPVNIGGREKLKILVVVGKFPVISNPFILNQITGLIDFGHDVSIFSLQIDESGCEHAEVESYCLRDKLLTLKPLPESMWSRIQYVLLNGFSLLFQRPRMLLIAIKALLSGDYPLTFRFFHQLNGVANFSREEFDIIHAQFGHLGNMVMMLRAFGVLRGKLVTQFRGFDVSLAIRAEGEHYYDALFSSGDLFLPVCDFIKEKLIVLGAPRDKTFVQYSGIDIEKFEYGYKGRYDKEEALKIGSIGRLSEKKGYEYVIEALSILKKEGYRFTYEIVGDGELKKEINDLIDSYGLTDEVLLLGSRDHDFIVKFLHDIDIFISHNVTACSGDQEGIPNTIKEAMLSGAPVFTTYHAGIPELVKNEINGFLTEEKNIDELVDALKKHAFSSKNLDHIALNAMNTVIEMFDNKKLTEQLVNRYRSLLQLDACDL